jgi:hypothetical protein
VRGITVDTKKMQGIGGARYIIATKDHILMRNGGKGKIYAPPEMRAMTTPGRYTITVTAAAVDRDRYPVRLVPEEGPLIMGFGVVSDSVESVARGGMLQKTFELKANVDQTFTFDAWIDRGYFPYFSFENGHHKPITQVRAAIRHGKLPSSAVNLPYVGPAVRVSDFRIEGPFFEEWPPESYRKTFDSAEIPNLGDATTRERTVERFAYRAFRRPVTKEELTPYLRYLDKQHEETKDWNESLIRTFAAMMGSLDFLYLREEGGELDAFALASRLSYFLWSRHCFI